VGLLRATALVLFSLALFGVADDPLPRVRAKSDAPPANTNEPQSSSTIAYEMPAVTLAVEPIVAAVAVDARDAASAVAQMRDALASNDAPRFEAAYKRAAELGANVSAYEDIEKVWSYANTDPNGAFYGSEMHDRLAARHPGYAQYIERYRLVDGRGNVWYPTSETRQFLAGKVSVVPSVARATVREETSRPAPRHETRRRKHRAVHKAEAALPAPVVNDALANDIRNAAAPPVAAVNAPQPPPVQADMAASGGRATILFVVLSVIAVGLVTLFVRTPGVDEAEPLRPAS